MRCSDYLADASLTIGGNNFAQKVTPRNVLQSSGCLNILAGKTIATLFIILCKSKTVVIFNKGSGFIPINMNALARLFT